jgi:hypothetical protein
MFSCFKQQFNKKTRCDSVRGSFQFEVSMLMQPIYILPLALISVSVSGNAQCAQVSAQQQFTKYFVTVFRCLNALK